MRRHPARLVQTEPWRAWLEERGGVKQVIEHLRAGPLSPNQKQLLETVLAHPDASTSFYAVKLNVGQSSYFVLLNNLLQALSATLNQWKFEPPQRFQESALLTRLPAPLTPLVGAEESVATVVAILQRPGVRLLTLTGPGGVGKTRLAMAAGARLLEKFADGVFFIPLETLNDLTFLGARIAHSLNIETVAAQSLVEALKTYLRNRQVLLILDNFEQLIQGGGLVTELLEAAPALKVLITSREVLNLYGESRFAVPELTRPDPDHLPPLEQLGAWPAVDLFVQRVQARHPAFALTEANKGSVVDICNRLDGLPLAIELAAAQIKLLSPEQALPQLEHSLKSLRDTSRDRPMRQKTLWDAIDWSYRLLSESEKALFRRLVVFGREWGVDAAQAVCEIDDTPNNLDRLVDKSLLRYARQDENGDLRFQMLQAVREYALEQLTESAEAPKMQRRHAGYYLEMAQQAERTIGTPQQTGWMRQIKLEHENLQIALQWMLYREETEMALNLLGAVWRFYNMLNTWSETRLWMDLALAQGAHIKSAGRAKVLWGASCLAVNQGDYDRAVPLADEGLTLAREIGDKRLVGLLLQVVTDGLRRRREYAQAMRLLEESLAIFRELDDREEIAWVLNRIASICGQRGDPVRCKQTLQESLDIFRGMGHQWAMATTIRDLGRLALKDEDYALAAALLDESLSISRDLGTKQRISETLRDLALLLLQQGKLEEAKAALDESLAISQEIGDQMGLGWIFNFQGRLALQQSDIATARELFEKAEAVFRKIGDQTALVHNLQYLQRVALVEK